MGPQGVAASRWQILLGLESRNRKVRDQGDGTKTAKGYKLLKKGELPL